MTQDLSARLRRVEQQIRAFRELHSSELQLILDELTDIATQVEAQDPAQAGPAATEVTDPAVASPKRAKWLAEEDQKSAPRSRRDLLFGERDKQT